MTVAKPSNLAAFAFDGALLVRAVAATFENRGTAIDVGPTAFTPDFTEEASTPLLGALLLPIARACEAGERFGRSWSPGGPWSPGEA